MSERTPVKISPRLLLRGESVVASAGLAVGAVVLLVTGASAWWSVHAQRTAAERSHRESIQSVGDVLARTAEPLLASQDVSSLSALRSVVVDTARSRGLASCRILLADGKTVVASSDTSQIAPKLPEPWPEGVPPITVERDGYASMLFVPGRGNAILELRSGPVESGWGDWKVQAGAGVIAAVGLAGMLLAYRRLRARLRPLGAIREALRAIETGETSAGVLTVSNGFGPEAAAWNKLLSEREEMSRRLATDQVGQTGGATGNRSGDFGSACDALWMGLILVDEQMRVRYANGAAAAFLNTDKAKLEQADLSSALSEASVLDAVRDVAGGSIRKRVIREFTPAGAAGNTVLRVSVRPVRKEDAASAMLVIEDVTQQRAADAARNTFVAQATHELRTPLTNIRLYVEQALEEGDQDAALRAKCLNVINDETRRLERIVGDMLSVAEIEAGSLKMRTGDVRLGPVFEQLQAEYRAQAEEKRIGMAFEMPPKLGVLNGDRDKLVMALHNLVGNALKYTPEEGRVTVRVSGEAGRLHVDVIDTGIGINPEEQELIFEKFYRAKDKRLSGITGSGLGLTLAREVARLHGGDVTVSSQIDKGSTFRLTVPGLPEAA